MKIKIIPFDIELAKKIQAGEIEGKIVRNRHEVIILDYNSKKYQGFPIRIVHLDGDEVDYVTHEGLHIEVPDTDNEVLFKPFDKVLVRDEDYQEWEATFYSHTSHNSNCVFRYITVAGSYKQCIPYKGNEHLVGTTNKTKEE